MKKKLMIGMPLIGILVILFVIGCNRKIDNNKDISTQYNGELILRLADNHVKDYPTVRADIKFAELVEERTNGQIKIKVFSGGQLGDERAVIEQVQFGVIDLARTSISPLAEIDKKLGALMLPYLYRDREHMFAVLDGSLGDEFRNSLISNNIYGLAWYDAGARNFYNSKREIKSPEDMKDLKIRVQETELMMDLVSHLGAIPVPMVFGEVYGGIKAEVIQGGENNWPSYISTAHNKVAKYITIDEHIRVPELIVINKLIYDKLTKEQQQIIEECAKEAAVFQRDEWCKDEKKASEIAVQEGSVITILTPEERERFKAAVMPIYDDFESQKDIINQIINTR